ncbi:MAG: TatD family deoxyribonuclease [Betaproteobacteria bacterium]|nr:TatD family deoxyribonuclease [Betaproteobacteria bacterium]
MTLFIDTHCHLDAPEFASDLANVRARARQAGVGLCVWPAVHTANFEDVRQRAVAQGDAYALGIHPLFTPQASDQDLHALDQALTAAAGDPHLVAVGEIGLDGWVAGLDMARQTHFYRAQLALAQRHRLPVLLHVRRSADGLLQGLRQCAVVGGLAHAFNGSRQQADQFLNLGFKLGFGGAMTFERALQLRRLARGLPADALVLETDAPDIPPRWLYRTQAERALGVAMGRNEPAELIRIAQCLADLRGQSLASLAHITTANAMQALPKLVALCSAAARRTTPA